MTETQNSHLALWQFSQLPTEKQILVLLGASVIADARTTYFKCMGRIAIRAGFNK